VKNPTLYGLLEALTADAAARLTRATADDDGIPFEVVESASEGGSAIPLYCYRPLTTAYIRSHLGLLVALPSYAPVARALEHALGTEAYLRTRGESRPPEQPRERSDLAIRLFLARVFAERSEFAFDPERFSEAYEELERSLYLGMGVAEVVAPILGLDLDADTDELVLGDGISIVRRSSFGDPPRELWISSDGRPAASSQVPLLLVLRIAQERAQAMPVALARTRFRRFLTALRLFDRGTFVLGPFAFSRIDGGEWMSVPLGTGGRARTLTILAADQEDELRAFCNLITRRLPPPGSGPIAWALGRFEMGFERAVVGEALSDFLLGLRALLEPEGTASGRLAQRLSVICAPHHERAELAERVAAAIALERAVINGTAADADNLALVADELANHLRAIIRDVFCGHLDDDVRAIADGLLAEAAAAL
jgi:hypothetical protein